jgi:uncharacterized protein involved in response to NO
MTRTSPAPASRRSWHGHPLWLVGFRPFFLLAVAAAVVLPLIWVLLLTNAISAPAGLSPMTWHAHEMFFGFGFAVLGGFLLTATKNWVSVRGHSGQTLQALVAAWLFERAGMWWGGAWPAWLRLISLNLFTVSLVGLLSWTLLRHRKKDSYPDNFLFLVALPVFLAARALLLDPAHFAEGREVTLAIFRLAFLVMLERTLTPFMKSAFQIVLPKRALLDLPIKGLALVLLGAPWMPVLLRQFAGLLLAGLIVIRLVTWSPHRAFRRVELAVMYLGMLAIAAQLALSVASAQWVGSMSLHVFTFGAMGLIIPAMLVRIGLGHTGRPAVFERRDQVVLWVMLVAFVARIVLPQVVPAFYAQWLWLSALGWMLGFALVGVRLAPMLLAERVDGREH